MIFEMPAAYPTYPAQHKAHIQLQRFLYKIRKENGFRSNVNNVYLERKDFENAGEPVAINSIWRSEEIQNASDVNNTIQMLEIKAQVLLDCYLQGEDMALERANLKADLIQILTSHWNYKLPEVDGDTNPQSATVFNLIPATFTSYGDDQQNPVCKLECELYVWYRLRIGDPNTLEA